MRLPGGLRWVDLGVTGEALLNPRLLSIGRRILDAAPECSLNMVTNGTLLTEDLPQGMVELPLHAVTFSVDGVAGETFQRLRGGADLERVLGGIRRLNAARDEAGLDRPMVHLCFTASLANYRELPALVELGAELGVVEIHVNNVEPYSEASKEQSLYLYPPADLGDTLAEAREKADGQGTRLFLPLFEPRRPTAGCRFMIPGVTWDGEVVPCAALSYERDYYFFHRPRRYPRLSFGNLTRSGLGTVLESEGLGEFRRRVECGDYPTPCRFCMRNYGVICG